MTAPLLLLALLSAPASLLAPQGPPTPAADSGQRLSLYLGRRSLDEADWKPVDQQIALGVEYSSCPPDAVIGWEIGTAFSRDTDEIGNVDVQAVFVELYGGLRKEFDTSSAVRPYLGFGVTLIAVGAEASSGGLSASDEDGSPGLYAHGGATVDVGDNLFLGVDLRAVVGTDLEIEGVGVDADYTQVALVLGFSL